MKTIEIIVSPTGQTQVETKGFTGSECREASRFLEEALGAQVSEQLTAEFHQQQPQQNQPTKERNMPRVRQRVLRSPRRTSAGEPRRLARLDKKSMQLEKERAALAR